MERSPGLPPRAGVARDGVEPPSANATYLSMGLLNSLGKSAEKVTISRAPEARDY